MRKTKLVVVTSMLLILFACENGNSLFSTSIGTILQNPRYYEGKTVKVSGEVTESMNLLLVKYFVLKDDTGTICVVTERILPKQGTSVTVKGSVEEAFTIGEEQLLVVIEGKKNQ